MRLVNADKIKLPQGFFEKVDNVPKFYEWLDEQPTVDAVPVVRCKDCMHREVQVDGVFRYELCGMRNEIINLYGFCHMGKRREDAND